MNDLNFRNIIKFLKTSYKLKEVHRSGWLRKTTIKNPESVAEHIYGTMILCYIISKINGLNTYKMLIMSLIHDLAESKIGDRIPEDGEKRMLENKEFKKIIENLPSKIRIELNDIWDEINNKNSKESKIFSQIDKLEMGVQAKEYIYSGGSKKELQEFIDSTTNNIDDITIKTIFNELDI